MPITSVDRYIVTRHKGGLLPLASPTLLIAAGSISGTATHAIGFPFAFDGASYSGDFFVRVAGYVRLAGSISSSVNSNLFGTNNSICLAPWWDSCGTVTGGDGVRTELQGQAPWRRRVIEFHLGMSGAGNTNQHVIRTQVVLYETTAVIEFRYAPRVQLGTGSSSSASAGVKGDTSVVASNFRDISADALSLGGRNSSPSNSLGTSTYDAFAALGIIRIEPNWPMCGFKVPMPDSLLFAPDPLRQALPGQPSLAWRIANNVNTLFCKHTPPLVNVTPVTSHRTDALFVVPIKPSADTRLYSVHIITWSSSAADCSCLVSYGDPGVPSPQPHTDGDWTALERADRTVGAAVIEEWPPFNVTLEPDWTFLRFYFDEGTMQVMSIVVRPVELEDFEPTDSFPSGFVPMAIGQIAQRDAAVHPEWLNRAHANVAHTLRDHWQALWSLCLEDDTDTTFAPISYAPARILGHAACTLGIAREEGWDGQEVVAETYCCDDVGARVAFRDLGGDAVAFEVGGFSGDYRLFSDELALVGDQPTVLLQAEPKTAFRAVFSGLRWAPDLGTSPLIRGITPRPRLDYLVTLCDRIERAWSAWAMTGLATRLWRGSFNPVMCAWVVPPGVRYLRPRLSRASNDDATQAADASIYGASSGSSPADEVLIGSPFDEGETWPPDRGLVEVIDGAEVINDVPTDPMDRLLESPTSGQTSAARETVRVTRGVGITLVPYR